MINASFSCTQEMSIYVDGKTATSMISLKPIKGIDCYQFRPLPIYFAIPQATQVIAIAVLGNKGPTIMIGSFTDGVVTNSTWRCTTRFRRNWELPGFDDRHWEQAEEITPVDENGGTDNLTGISPKAKWIGTDASENMYCRLRRKIK